MSTSETNANNGFEPMFIHNASKRMVCRFVSAKYHDRLAAAVVNIAKNTSCDMTGTLDCITELQPDCQAIFVSEGDLLDVIYRLDKGFWLAHSMRNWPANHIEVCPSMINDVLSVYAERSVA